MVKNYTVRLMCPYGDGEQYITLQNREEPLKRVLETSCDFECPTHGVQREFPLDAREKVPVPPPKQIPPMHTSRRVPEKKFKIQKEPRFPKQIRVWVEGRDHNGNPFKQSAYSVDISRSGARLHGVGLRISAGSAIELQRLWRSARFRVVWAGRAGTPQANELGLSCLEPTKNFWALPQAAGRR